MRCVRQSPDVWSVDICLAGKCARGVMSDEDDPSRVVSQSMCTTSLRTGLLTYSAVYGCRIKITRLSIRLARPRRGRDGDATFPQARTHTHCVDTDERRGSEGHSIRTSTTHKRTRARNNGQREEIVWPGESRHTCAARLRRLSALSASLPGRIHLRSSSARCTHDE